jgi:hypothetical protein
MNSHEYAKKLNRLADLLLSKPEFETANSEAYSYSIFSYWNKENFLGAVKALGSGKKEWQTDDLTFIPHGTDMLKLTIGRNKVCRKVKEAEYECEPLLSQAEEAAICV